jgi:hypothetical protein
MHKLLNEQSIPAREYDMIKFSENDLAKVQEIVAHYPDGK